MTSNFDGFFFDASSVSFFIATVSCLILADMPKGISPTVSYPPAAFENIIGENMTPPAVFAVTARNFSVPARLGILSALSALSCFTAVSVLLMPGRLISFPMYFIPKKTAPAVIPPMIMSIAKILTIADLFISVFPL